MNWKVYELYKKSFLHCNTNHVEYLIFCFEIYPIWLTFHLIVLLKYSGVMWFTHVSYQVRCVKFEHHQQFIGYRDQFIKLNRFDTFRWLVFWFRSDVKHPCYIHCYVLIEKVECVKFELHLQIIGCSNQLLKLNFCLVLSHILDVHCIVYHQYLYDWISKRKSCYTFQIDLCIR